VGLVLPELVVLIAGASWYCGLSGLSHAMLAAALAYEFMRRRGAARAFVLVAGAIAALKPLYELVTGAPAFPLSLGDGVRQAPLAHVTGVCVGIAVGLAAGVPCRDAPAHRLHRLARHRVARPRG